MPELPEVETIKRVIEPQIKGLEICGITANRKDVIAYPSAEIFCKSIENQIISTMYRRGKFLTILLESGDKIILHLRMTGCLLVTPPNYLLEKHTHIIFQLSNRNELRFSDTRRFGRFWLIKSSEEDTYSGIQKLGLEPFDDVFNAEYLKRHFVKRRKSIKECLLEQSVIAGIGNIYSDEILFASKICPERSAGSLTDMEWQKLAEIIPKQLSYYIEKNNITAEDYLQSKGKEYRNTPFLKVYGHDGDSCPNCGNILCRTVIGGRSSVFCSVCQTKD